MAGNGGLSSPVVGTMVPTGMLPDLDVDRLDSTEALGYNSLQEKVMSWRQRVQEMGAGGHNGTENQIHRGPKLSYLSNLRHQGTQVIGSGLGL